MHLCARGEVHLARVGAPNRLRHARKEVLDTGSARNPAPVWLGTLKADPVAEGAVVHQAVLEVAETVIPFIEENPKYKAAKILERIAEPERVIMFRVPWLDDKGEYQINRGFRIQMNSAIGPYKGGLRFHPTVYLGILKFLALFIFAINVIP